MKNVFLSQQKSKDIMSASDSINSFLYSVGRICDMEYEKQKSSSSNNMPELSNEGRHILTEIVALQCQCKFESRNIYIIKKSYSISC